MVSAAVRATTDMFKIQFDLEARAGTPFPEGELEIAPPEVVGVGMLCGSAGAVGVSLSFSLDSCTALMDRLFVRQIKGMDEEVRRAVLELVSILCARMKGNLLDDGAGFDRVAPLLTVLGGNLDLGFSLVRKPQVVPFEISKVGEFHLRIF